MTEHFKNRSAEENVSLGVVIIAVKTVVALEVILVVEEIVCNTVNFLRENAAVLMTPANRNSEVGDKAHLFLLLGFDCVDIVRHNNTRVVPCLNECFGKRTCYICETAACCKGQRFACCI